MGYDKKQLKELMKPLYGFRGKRIKPVRVITLPVSFGTPKKPSYRVHNLRCGWHAVLVQCHFWTGAIKPLPQGPSHLWHNNDIWQSKRSQKHKSWFHPSPQKRAFPKGRCTTTRASTTAVQAEGFDGIQKSNRGQRRL
jgi:hypothetical protein